MQSLDVNRLEAGCSQGRRALGASVQTVIVLQGGSADHSHELDFAASGNSESFFPIEWPNEGLSRQRRLAEANR